MPATTISSRIIFTDTRDSPADTLIKIDFTQTTTTASYNKAEFIQTLTTTASQLVFTGVTGVPKMLYFRNLDTTNNALIATATGFASDEQFATLLPGQQMIFPPSSAVIWVKSSASTVDLQIVAEGA